MKLRRVLVENVRSFLEPQELYLEGDISIIIGPNGGGKTNLLDAVITTLRRQVLQSWVARPVGNARYPQLEQFESNDQMRVLRRY